MVIIFFIIYLLIFGYLASLVLGRLFGFAHNFSKKVLGIFTVFISLGWIAGAATIFLPLRTWVWVGIFILNGLIYILLARLTKDKEKSVMVTGLPDDPDVNWKVGFRTAVLVFLGLLAWGFYLLYTSRTGESVLTPWQTIKPQYVFVFFLSTYIFGLLIFSKLKTKTILLFLILQTFLLHSYLPFTHQLIYGADGWRHMANEQRLLENKSFLEATLRGESLDNDKSQTASSESQNLKSKIGQLSYGNFWATSVLLAKILKTDLLTITKWFLPIAWSVVLPIILFELAMCLGWGTQRSLFFSWLGLLPFAWQAAGSFSLPVSFGLLTWLFLVLLIVKRAAAPRGEQKLILALLGVGMIFGYALYFVLFWLAWIAAEVLLKWSSQRAVPQRNDGAVSLYGSTYHGIASSLRLLAMTIVVAIAVPVLELIAGYSQFDAHLNWLGQIKQAVGNFFGYYLAVGPRPHDIATGNIIFNQTPLAAFVPNIFTQWHGWILIFNIAFFAFLLYGLFRAWQYKKLTSLWLAVMGAGLTISYAITNYFLAGSHILARRLDGVVALFLIGLFGHGLYEFLLVINRYPVLQNSRLLKLCIHKGGILILSIAIIASYSLGPDTNTVSANQYEAAAYIWSQEKNTSTTCVLGDTYPLLALEAMSAKEIIGGNFPIDANFGQPERVELFAQSKIAINNSLLEKTTQLTRADHCWFMGQTNNFQQQGILQDQGLKIFGDTAVVRYNNISL
jgi:hypothetical protein